MELKLSKKQQEQLVKDALLSAKRLGYPLKKKKKPKLKIVQTSKK